LRRIELCLIDFKNLYVRRNFSTFLNFYSHHPSWKRHYYYIRCNRILLSHPKFHEHNLIDAVHTFLENGHFIFATIHNKFLFYIRKYKNSHISYFSKKEISANKYFTIPYVKSVSESFRPIAFKMNSKLAFSIPNALNKYIKRDKDQFYHIKRWFTKYFVRIAKSVIWI